MSDGHRFEDQDTFMGYLELFLYEDPYFEDEVLTEIRVILPNGKERHITCENDKWGDSLFVELERIFQLKVSPEKGRIYTWTDPEYPGVRDYYCPVTLYIKIDEYKVISEDVLGP